MRHILILLITNAIMAFVTPLLAQQDSSAKQVTPRITYRPKPIPQVVAPTVDTTKKENSLEGNFSDGENVFALGSYSNPNPFALEPQVGQIHSSSVESVSVDTAQSSSPKAELLPEEPSQPGVKGKSWFLFVLLLVLGYLTAVTSVYSEQISDVFRGFLNFNAASQIFREKGHLITISGMLLYLLFVISGGVLLFQITQAFEAKITGSPVYDLLLCILGVSVVYMLRHLLLWVVSGIFPFGKETSMFAFLIGNTNKALGIVLVPFLFLVAYAPESLQMPSLWFTLGLLAVVHAYRAVTGLMVAGTHLQNHKFHFFMYLCVVEIAPVLILVKMVIG